MSSNKSATSNIFHFPGHGGGDDGELEWFMCGNCLEVHWGLVRAEVQDDNIGMPFVPVCLTCGSEPEYLFEGFDTSE